MTETAAQKRIFFPNLDGLRFICFLMVFLYHCNETIFNKISNPLSRKIVNFCFQNGNIGVDIFFVLSGFLITFLLIEEKTMRGTISLGNFYIRRILRIWPLFYLCVFLGFVFFPLIKYHTFPVPGEVSNYWYYIFFAGNFDMVRIWPKVPGALSLIVLWSVGVEEQFYITWPVILKFSNRRVYPYLFAAIVLFTIIFRSFYTGNTTADYAVRFFHTFSVIGDMAIGAMAAYFCSYDNSFLRFIKKMSKAQIIILYVITIASILFRKVLFQYPVTMMTERAIMSMLFAMIIAEQNFCERSIFKFSSFKTISKLGIYTYALYCLHFIGILAVQLVMDKSHYQFSSTVSLFIAGFIALLITILLSIASYHLFEKHFLRLKDKFAFIVKK